MILMEMYQDGDWEKIADPIEPFTPMCDEFKDVIARGFAVTALDNGKALACGGVSFTDEKHGTVWLKISRECIKRPIMWARTIKETFAIMVSAAGGAEICTYILDGFRRGERVAALIKMVRTEESVEYKDNIYNKYVVVI